MYSLMGVSPAMKQMHSSAYAEFHQKLDFFMSVRMALYAKVTLAINVLLLIVTIRKSNKTVLLLTIFGFLLFFAEIFFTVTVNVPLNEKIQTWDINHLPQQWEAVRDKWLRFDAIRSICAMISFIVFLAAFQISNRKEV
jgi:uncharacterized membrane protein